MSGRIPYQPERGGANVIPKRQKPMSEDTLEDVKEYLAPSEAGTVLGVSAQWVKQLLRRGELEGIETRLGWLVRPESLSALALRRQQELKLRLQVQREAMDSVSARAGGRSAHGRRVAQKRGES